jgi:class 3 adenylate cyclase/tetratricopeptide (TPR) repeat protein
MRCTSCGTDNPPGFKFCGACGAALAATCPNCSAPVPPGMKFCGECGFALTNAAPPPARAAPAAAAAAAAPAPAPAGATTAMAERRLVTVLFADLVGFTSTSESRDPEEVREFLSRYFDVSRRLVELYGGTVEKYIGDAVVAFWGAVTAKEDDAERGVRAALDLVQAVASLGEEAGLPALQARAAVLTGEAAVTVGGVSEGMVHGDVVNTASRVQALAPAGAVLVGESTKRLSEAAVVYEDFGEHDVKGKEEPVHAWRALRVVAARGGSQRHTGLEPPFIGRDRELRHLKEMFHQTLEDGKAQMVSITGIPGIGKSRLAWEFFKYVDGVTEKVRWHAGRSLAYGEGVTYWALAEMVRTRIGIVEGEVGETALAKLHQTIVEAVPDEEERRWIEPRLAQLVGLAESVSSDRQDLFAAWRRFYERLSEDMPTVMVFEDMQWADPSLIEFIDYLLDWSRNYRLFIVTLGRAGESEKASGRGHTAIHLESLGRSAMEQLISAVVPGLSPEVRTSILDRAQGVPLYAVETIRMLIDRGLLAPDGATYRPTGPIDSLEVPETLQTLIAARLDGLSPDERRLVQYAAVLGKTFSAAGLEFVSGASSYDVQEALTTMVRKELLTVEASPTSPERGQYGFLQDLVRQVAYDTVGRNERRELHLKVAAFLEQSFDEDQDEVVEVLASHYLEAYRANPDAPDAAAIKTKAKDMLLGAGQRAGALGAAEEAQTYYEKAAELIDAPSERAQLLDRAGAMALQRSLIDHARRRFEEAIELFESVEDRRGAALTEAHLADIERLEGRLREGGERLEKAMAVLAGDEPDEATATVAAEFGRMLALGGDDRRAAPALELALTQAEDLELPEVFAQALNTKGMMLMNNGRFSEAAVLLRASLNVALENELSRAAMRGYNNLTVCLVGGDRLEDTIDLDRSALELARKVGDRQWELNFLVGALEPMALNGRWDEAIAQRELIHAMIDPEAAAEPWIVTEVAWTSMIELARGNVDAAAALIPDSVLQHEQREIGASMAMMRAAVFNAQGRHEAALGLVREMASEVQLPPQAWAFKLSWYEAMAAALGVGDTELARALLERAHSIRRGRLTPFLRAQIARYDAVFAARDGALGRAEAGYKAAAGILREGAMPFHLAVCLTEFGEWYRTAGRDADAEEALNEARAIFTRLGATPWLERLGAVPASGGEAVPT